MRRKTQAPPRHDATAQKHHIMKPAFHDMEKPPADALPSIQHIASPAIPSLELFTRNVRKLLPSDGFLVMLEMTETMYWVNTIYNLLEVW
jgi:hypothetical protein